MQQHSVNFQGRFDQRDIEDVQSLSMIQHGPDIENGVFTMSAQSIAQLRITSGIQFS